MGNNHVVVSNVFLSSSLKLFPVTEGRSAANPKQPESNSFYGLFNIFKFEQVTPIVAFVWMVIAH